MLAKEQLSQDQADALSTMQQGATYLSGIAGTGKTTTALYHILNLVEQGIPASQILILVPQKTLARPYYELVEHFNLPAGSIPTIVTLSGLAQRMITLFWPLVNSLNLFATPDSPPVFLTLETAQYYLAAVADPIMDGSGYFSSLHIQRNRLYSQILDNLNKATLVGFPLETLSERLTAAWNGESGHTIIYQQAQEIVLAFRKYCYQHNLLDFSLQMDLFEKHLAHQPVVQQYLQNSFTHIIYDNIEEDAPISHDLIETWLPHFENVLLISDDNAGYRTFLGADPVSANRFVSHCTNTISFLNSFQSSIPVQKFSSALSGCIFRDEPAIDDDIPTAFQLEHFRLAPESSRAVVQEITALVESGVAPEQIVVLTPILNDTTRFTLADALGKTGNSGSIPSTFTPIKCRTCNHLPFNACQDCTSCLGNASQCLQASSNTNGCNRRYGPG